MTTCGRRSRSDGSLPVFLRGLFRPPLFGAVAPKHVDDAVVALVARVLVDHPVARSHRQRCRPRPGVEARVLDGELVVDGLWTDPTKPFDDAKRGRVNREPEPRVLTEVRRLDDERVAL